MPAPFFVSDRLKACNNGYIFADRLADLITEDIVVIDAEIEAEERFEAILRAVP